jgi:hypothetical protein
MHQCLVVLASPKCQDAALKDNQRLQDGIARPLAGRLVEQPNGALVVVGELR